jgi:hypothetical protein
MACASGARPDQRDSTRNDRGSPGQIPGEPLSLLLSGGVPGCGNDEHSPSRLDVPEHFREPEILRPDNHRFLFCVIRLTSAHLFRFRMLTRAVRREASPPSDSLSLFRPYSGPSASSPFRGI